MSQQLDEKDISLEKLDQQNNPVFNKSYQKKKKETQKSGEVNEVDIFDAGQESGELRHPQIFKVLDSNIFGFFVTILTVYALFGDDIRTIAFDRNADLIFDIITSISFFVFLFEIGMSWLVKDDYKYSFFFWLDAISTLSLILDIQFISNQLFSSTTATNTAQLARAGRASRVGTKAGRIVRLVRLIRIVKLYKATQDTKKNKEANNPLQPYGLKKNKKFGVKLAPQLLNMQDGEEIYESQEEDKLPDDLLEFKESRVSKQLSNLTTKRVIIIVLLLLFVMPLFSADYFFDWPDPLDYSLSTLKNFTENPNTTIDDIKNYYEQIKIALINLDQPLVSLTGPFNFTEDFNVDNWATILRDSEMNRVVYTVNQTLFNQKYSSSYFEGTYDYNGVLSQKAVTIIDSGLSLGRTIFVCIVLTMGALFFSKDANELALRPIERMMHKVNQIARNPLLAKEQKLLEEKGKNQYETTIIENAIIKIGTLLALGFGDAGSEIIGSNMKTLGDVNPMIPGKKRVAIYGFCDIRNFTDATEQLQKDVMVFVNTIGEVVHTIVDRFNGAANKNIGDAFLLVWKFPDDKVSINDKNEINYLNQQWVHIQADYACISFVKIQAKINRRTKILDYRHDTRLTSRMPNYKVKIGYGLHFGWSIEGAIGSDYKIDASYLSAHVNMANRLESGTKAYGIPILITSQLACLFTSKMKEIVRQIDMVEVKGFGSYFGLFTVDMKVEDLPPCSDNNIITPHELIQLEKARKIFLKKYQDDNTWDARSYMIRNKEMRIMCFEFVDPTLRKDKRELINATIQFKGSEKQQDEKEIEAKYKLDDFQNRNQDFRKEFDEGFYLYTRGRWQESKICFEKAQHCLRLKEEPMDGPTTVLLDFMGASEFRAPIDWKGYRFTGEL